MVVINRFLVTLLLLIVTSTAFADKYSKTVELFRNAGDSSTFFDHCYGYAVFPTVGKVGFILGAARGGGRVYINGQQVGETTMTQVSVGATWGGQGFSQIIFFQDERAFAEFSSGNFEFGGKMEVVVVTAGANAKTTTTGPSATASGQKTDAKTKGTTYYKGYKIFTIAKGGLMLDVSAGGQKFSYSAVGPHN
ncbi:MAG: hypothetical protein CMD74_03280 [Gammaproteobacteria bacterium]|nr:hypothetical protein [Gammaproteobacteria bacterium]